MLMDELMSFLDRTCTSNPCTKNPALINLYVIPISSPKVYNLCRLRAGSLTFFKSLVPTQARDHSFSPVPLTCNKMTFKSNFSFLQARPSGTKSSIML